MIAPALAEPHTDAAIKLLTDLASVTNSTVLIGEGEQPPDSGWQGEPEVSKFRPYIVLFPTAGLPDGIVAEPMQYFDYRIQATCVAASQRGAARLADFVKTAWVNQPLDVPGRSSYLGQLIIDSTITRDDTKPPPVYYTIMQVVWRTQAT